VRLILKTVAIFFFVIVYWFKTYSGFKNDPNQFPHASGLTHSSGIYNVSEFRINNKTLPYSDTDRTRWKDVVFEKWPTISVRSNRPVIIDSINYERINQNDADRDYELLGSGGRHYYRYSVDSLQQVLLLENKNPNYRNDKLVLKYSRPDSSTIILKGVDQQRDSLYVVLNRVDKKYPIQLGRRRILKL
jgi:hypothetical protein